MTEQENIEKGPAAAVEDDSGAATPPGLTPGRMVLDMHTYVRDKIVAGEFPPGAIIPQADLARQLGVSRGPVREALRRLEDEGLIVAEVNRRPRVASFDPDTLDSLYGVRITTEAFGVRVTCALESPSILSELNELLGRLRELDVTSTEWREVHRHFNGVLVSGAGSVLEDLTSRLAERSEPYYRLYGGTRVMGEADHKAVVAAFEAHDCDSAARIHARHVARTALSTLAVMAPEYDPRNVREALRNIGVNAPEPETAT